MNKLTLAVIEVAAFAACAAVATAQGNSNHVASVMARGDGTITAPVALEARIAAVTGAVATINGHIVDSDLHWVPGERAAGEAWKLTNRVTRVYNQTNANEWTEGDGIKWRVNYVAETNIIVTFSNPFGKMTGPDAYDRPNELSYISPPNSQIDADNYWLINFDPNGEGLWNIINSQYGIWWAGHGYNMPIVAEHGMVDAVGTATFDYLITFTAVTSSYDTVATESFVARSLAVAPTQTLTSIDGMLRFDSGFSKWYRTILTNGYELYFEVTP